VCAATASIVDGEYPLTEMEDATLPDDSDMDAPAQPKCQNVFLGWSTGHVGTTTASARSTYQSSGDNELKRYRFMFERGQIDNEVYLDGLTLDEQVQHVRQNYLRGWASSHHTDDKCVDLSHANLFFVSGLLKEMLRMGKNVTMIRMRRPFYETALSLMKSYRNLGAHDNSVGCALKGVGRLCPLAAGKTGENVVLKVPAEVYTNWTMLQKTLWQMDEVEAQWSRMKATHRGNITFVEVSWSEAENDFTSSALPQIAKVLGLTAVAEPDIKKAHLSISELWKLDQVPREEFHDVIRYVEDMLVHSPSFHLRATCLSALFRTHIAGGKNNKEDLLPKEFDPFSGVLCTTLMGSN
jgi:hypothetical protein